MRTFRYLTAICIFGAFAAPAFAQDEAPASAVTVSGSAAITSDYRFRGISQSDENIAVQSGITIAHDSGFYIGTWGRTWRAGARLAARTWNST